MDKSAFLKRVKKEGKLRIREPSKAMSESYFQKAHNCLQAAKIVYQSNLYENAVIDSYYSMYNALLALLFQTGIKSENHTASILVLSEWFNEEAIAQRMLRAKEQRRDKQYYTEQDTQEVIQKEEANQAILEAEDMTIQLQVCSNKVSNEFCMSIKKKFEIL